MKLLSFLRSEPPKKDYSVCSECGVHFEPTLDGLFRDFCSTHRAPKIAAKARQDKVLVWAQTNWEKLEPQSNKYWKAKEAKETGDIRARSEMNQLQQKIYAQMQNTGAAGAAGPLAGDYPWGPYARLVDPWGWLR